MEKKHYKIKRPLALGDFALVVQQLANSEFRYNVGLGSKELLQVDLEFRGKLQCSILLPPRMTGSYWFRNNPQIDTPPSDWGKFVDCTYEPQVRLEIPRLIRCDRRWKLEAEGVYDERAVRSFELAWFVPAAARVGDWLILVERGILPMIVRPAFMVIGPAV